LEHQLIKPAEKAAGNLPTCPAAFFDNELKAFPTALYNQVKNDNIDVSAFI
jgi:hypothetical protein